MLALDISFTFTVSMVYYVTVINISHYLNYEYCFIFSDSFVYQMLKTGFSFQFLLLSLLLYPQCFKLTMIPTTIYLDLIIKLLPVVEMYLQPCQTPKIENFMEIANDFLFWCLTGFCLTRLW